MVSLLCEKCKHKEKDCYCGPNDTCNDYIHEEATGTVYDSIILDSGNRREFENGFVRDMSEGKGRMDLLPWRAIRELSKHCEAGAIKYGERNIDKGAPQNCLLDSAFRHLCKYMEGEKDENHLLSAFWNIAWAVQQEYTRPELQNIPNRL